MAVEPSSSLPQARFLGLETLWFQVAGTLCNLRCTHCFISCSPDNHTLELMDEKEIGSRLEEARRLGVREIYFTGGEPFIHPRFLEILEGALRFFPTSVLTNGLPINDARADHLARLHEESPYSLEIRISLDHHQEEANDAVRGKGVFRRALAAYTRLYDRGFLPILTVTEIHDYLHPDDPERDRFQKYVELLRAWGIDRPRVKIIPIFEMGMLPGPDRPRLLEAGMMCGFDDSILQCSSSRLVAHNGVYACPILAGEEGALMGHRLEDALRPCDLYHPACTTCYATGMTCKNF